MNKDKETLWEKMFKKTPKEEEIQSRIDAEYERFDNSPEHLAHKERLKVLFAEMRQAQAERQEEGKRYRREKFPRKVKDYTETEEEREARIAENKRIHEEKVNSYPANLRDAIKLYESLSEEEKKIFGYSTWCYRVEELDEMQNKQITHEQTRELHDILVQTCIDFINDNNLKDVDVVAFSADSLQESARFNEWTPATDSFLTLEGIEKDDKLNFHVRKFIDKSF